MNGAYEIRAWEEIKELAEIARYCYNIQRKDPAHSGDLCLGSIKAFAKIITTAETLATRLVMREDERRVLITKSREDQIKELEADQFRLNGLVKRLDAEKGKLSEEITRLKKDLEIAEIRIEAHDKTALDLMAENEKGLEQRNAASLELKREKEAYRRLRDTVEDRVSISTFQNIIRRVEKEQ